jgi:hypothetical protein
MICVCPIQDHEGAEDDEEPTAHSRGHLTNLATLHAQDSRYQEGLLTSLSAAGATE